LACPEKSDSSSGSASASGAPSDKGSATPTTASAPSKPSGSAGAPASGAPSNSGSATPTTASAPAPSNEITFTKQKQAVGTGWDETSTEEEELSTTKPQNAVDTEVHKKALRRDILAVAGNRISKIRLTYGDRSGVETYNGKERPSKGAVSGKTYIAEYKGNKVVVADDKGNSRDVTVSEEREVKTDVRAWLGKPDPVLTDIPGTVMKLGDAADSMADVLRDFFSWDIYAVELSEASVKLQRVSDEGAYRAGVFDVKVKVTAKGSVLESVYDLAGTMTVRADTTRLTSVRLAGPVTLTGVIAATGTAKLNVDYKY
jgi:hypothetical protein